MDEKGVKVDRMNIVFARTMEIATLIGLVLMAIPGILFFAGIRQFVNVDSVVQNWDKSASEFWEVAIGTKVSGYSWFMNNVTYMDYLTILGVVFLAFIPLLSLVVVLPKADKKYKAVLGVLIIEFVFAIIRPLIMAVGGE